MYTIAVHFTEPLAVYIIAREEASSSQETQGLTIFLLFELFVDV